MSGFVLMRKGEKMPRYIDAEKITFDLSGLAYILPTDMHKIGEYFMRQLQAMPVVDVRPVVKGPSEQPEKAEYIPDTKAIPSKRDCVDLAERVTATFYSEENEEWGQKTVTIADILDSVCDDYTVLPSAQPYTEAEIQKMQDLEQAELEKAFELGKTEANRWIPCSERTPEEDHWLGGSGKQFSENVMVTIVNHSDEDTWVDMAHTVDGEWMLELPRHCEITAWMPSPEPYKGEQ